MKRLELHPRICDVEERQGYINGDYREFRLFVRADFYERLEKAAGLISLDVDEFLTGLLRKDLEEAAQDLQELRER